MVRPKPPWLGFLVDFGRFFRPKAGCGELPGPDGDVDGPFQGEKKLHETELG